MPIYAGFDGTPLHYDDSAVDSGRSTVIVIAGGAARHPDYLGDLAGLGDRYRLVVPHLRGVGRSPAVFAAAGSPLRAGSYWRQAEDVDRLRACLGLERVVLAGHSAGTRLAVAYAARFPDRLSGLALITPPAGYLVDVQSDVDEMILARAGDPQFAAAVAASVAGPDLRAGAQAFNDWHRRCAPMGYATWGPAERAHAAVGSWSPSAVEAYFSIDVPDDLPRLLGRVTAPTLVVAGADDCLTGLAPVLAVADLFPHGRAAVIEQCGHYPWVEQPEAFGKAMDDFLDGLGQHQR